MFQHRSSAFAPSVTAIQKHLGAVEKELENIGRIAGRSSAKVAAEASDQVGQAISGIVNDMLDRARDRGQAAGNQAIRLGNQAAALGGAYSKDALDRVRSGVGDQPLLTVGVALGVGVLIGLSLIGSMRQS